MTKLKFLTGVGAVAFGVGWLLACGGVMNQNGHPSFESGHSDQNRQPSSGFRQTGSRQADQSSESRLADQNERAATARIDDEEASDIIAWLNAGRPALVLSNMRVGDIGSLSRVELFQIIDSSTALATIPDRYGIPGEMFFIRGFNFANNVDGQQLSFPLLRVVGTTRYTTALGATKQVFVLEATGVNLEDFERELAAAVERANRAEAERLAAEKAARRAALDESQFRTWTSADGAYTIEARLAGFSFGNARLEKRNGEVVEVPSEKLSEADRDYISKEFDRR